jgi:hypothetical protein
LVHHRWLRGGQGEGDSARTAGKLVVRQGGEAEVVPPRQRVVAGAGGSGRRSRRVEAVVRKRLSCGGGRWSGELTQRTTGQRNSHEEEDAGLRARPNDRSRVRAVLLPLG